MFSFFNLVGLIRLVGSAEAEKRGPFARHCTRATLHTRDDMSLTPRPRAFSSFSQVDNLLPDYVIDDYKRCFGYLFHAEATTPSDVKGVMWI